MYRLLRISFNKESGAASMQGSDHPRTAIMP